MLADGAGISRSFRSAELGLPGPYLGSRPGRGSSALRGKRTLIGYIFGGIRAYPKEFPYRDDAKNYRSGNVPTKASDMIVPVYVTVPGK